MPLPPIPFAPHANFQNLANIEKALEKMQWCFHNMVILTSKAFTSDQTDHLSHVLINIFIVFLLRTDHIVCVCVCACSVLTVQVYMDTYHTSICIFYM